VGLNWQGNVHIVIFEVKGVGHITVMRCQHVGLAGTDTIMWSKEADFRAGAYPYLTKGRLATWDPRGRPPGEGISSPKGLLRQTT